MKKMFFLMLLGSFVHLYSQQPVNTIIIDGQAGKDTISKYIYGHFTEHLGRCIYGGIWVGKNSPIPNIHGIRTDVLEALRALRVPVVRWPGGCFADTYHWMDGIGQAEKRPKFVNTAWGGVIEDNSFGTHEFLEFCELLGAEPYLSVNVGSGTIKEARDWVEYVNSRNDSPMANLRRQNGRKDPWNVKFWGMGNETWGCGGNMTPEYYTHIYKQFATFCPGEFKVFAGGTADDLHWTETALSALKKNPELIQGYSYHNYTICHTWEKKGAAVQFDEQEWFNTMQKSFLVERDLKNHSSVMDQYDPGKKIALMADEWGNWFDPEPGDNPAFLYQQNTLRDALTAALYLNIFNNHCDRVKMANIAQMINVLQSVILTKDGQLVLTPTYYVFKLFTVHQDAALLPTRTICEGYSNGKDTIPSLSVSASKDKNGKIHISITNLDPIQGKNIQCETHTNELKTLSGQIITAGKMNAYNDFGKPEQVRINPFTDMDHRQGIMTIRIPAKSIVMIELDSQ